MVRTHWSATDEEARAYLQARLTLLYKIMFWAYTFMVLAEILLWTVTDPTPQYEHVIYVLSTTGLVAMGLVWRGFLVRHVLSVRALTVLDLVYAGGSGLILGACAILAFDYPPSHYVTGIYAFIAVFTRTIIVPSSGPRTLIAGLLLFGPFVAAAVVLAAIGDMGVLPRPVFAVGALLLAVIAILLATTGSDIIYGLRRQVSAAQQLGAYKLERKIGEGGMGAVYRAHHIMLRRPTAVKLLLPDRVGAENLERFEREVHHMSQLTHPNTVAVYDYGRSPDGVFYYAMEYLGGGIDLERLVRTHGPQPNGRVVQILTQICGALTEAHENGIIHRDIKPANIILCERGGMPDVAKVVDYGLVKEITSKNLDSQQVILGTPAYVAPEAITNPNSVGPAADLYALGAVGYYLVTGRRVFEGKTAVEVCIQHVTTEPMRPSAVSAAHVDAGLEDILMTCLRKRPGERFASAADMAAALRSLSTQQDWDLAGAQTWWREFRALERKLDAASRSATMTITVDLGERQ